MRQKYADQFEFDQISRILGMEKSALVPQDEEQGGMMAMILSIDWRYQVLCETHFHPIGLHV